MAFFRLNYALHHALRFKYITVGYASACAVNKTVQNPLSNMILIW
ncbi:hypothetical protein AS4_08080 [Acinetobacter guillouiae]|nr:hypothetical protein AS4_08080 [Acinetobacter guillouiae]